jgi:hypothetical protein
VRNGQCDGSGIEVRGRWVLGKVGTGSGRTGDS